MFAWRMTNDETRVERPLALSHRGRPLAVACAAGRDSGAQSYLSPIALASIKPSLRHPRRGQRPVRVGDPRPARLASFLRERSAWDSRGGRRVCGITVGSSSPGGSPNDLQARGADGWRDG